MPSFNCPKEMTDQVKSGERRHIIKPINSQGPTRPGLTVKIYGGRVNGRSQILKIVKCESALPISVHRHEISIDGRLLNNAQADQLAQREGFTLPDWLEHIAKKYGLPFNGEFLTWSLL